jgi:hypothetical protein
MVRVVRPALGRMVAIRMKDDLIDPRALVVLGGATIASALATQLMGLDFIIGAFLVGALIPPKLRKPILDRLQVMTVALLLPFFFALTGMRVLIDVDVQTLLDMFIAFAGVSAAGAMCGTAVAARLAGEEWKMAFGLGSLLQSKGLTELIVLTILLDARVVSLGVFTAMILMALFSTTIAMPLARLALGRPGDSLVTARDRGSDRRPWTDFQPGPPQTPTLRLGAGKRAAIDLPPSTNRSWVLYWQFRFHDLDSIETICPCRDRKSPAKLTLLRIPRCFIQQAQMRIEGVVRPPGAAIPRGREDPPCDRGFLELHEQRFGVAIGIVQSSGDQFDRREPGSDRGGVRPRFLLGRRPAEDRDMRFELDSVEVDREAANDRAQRRPERLPRHEPEGIFHVCHCNFLLLYVPRKTAQFAGERSR